MSCQVLGVFCCCPLFKFIKKRHHQGIHLLMAFYTASLKGMGKQQIFLFFAFLLCPMDEIQSVFMRGSCSIGRNCASGQCMSFVAVWAVKPNCPQLHFSLWYCV